MSAVTRITQRWRRFKRKYGGVFILGVVVLLIMALVAGLMYLLTSPDYRVRP